MKNSSPRILQLRRQIFMKERNRIVVQEMESGEKRERKMFRRHKKRLKKQTATLIREQAKL